MSTSSNLYEHDLNLWLHQTIGALKDQRWSLSAYLDEALNYAYRRARKLAAVEANLSLNFFPLESPFLLDQVLEEDFFPD